MIAKFEDGRVRTEVRDGNRGPGSEHSGRDQARGDRDDRRVAATAAIGPTGSSATTEATASSVSNAPNAPERPPPEPEFLDIRGGGRRNSPCHHRGTRSPECQTAVLL